VFRFRKSAGVSVGFRVHRLIRKGNTFRDLADWEEALRYYQAALQLHPDLVHIQIQMGHALYELGRKREAANAYILAFAAKPESSENFVFAERFLNCADEDKISIFREALQGRAVNFDEKWIIDSIISNKKYIFDITDLLQYYGHSRIPSGIQRVVGETAYSAVKMHPDLFGVCSYSSTFHRFSGIPNDLFVDIFNKSKDTESVSDENWNELLNNLTTYIGLSYSYRFMKGANLISLGANWSSPYHSKAVINAKELFSINYSVMIHDLIPVLQSKFCAEGHVKDFKRWLSEIGNIADNVISNSICTYRDYLSYIIELNGSMPMNVSGVVHVNALNLNDMLAVRSGLPDFLGDADEFVLFVSSIDPRKGHIYALDAWIDLYRKHGDNLPNLVCVGNISARSETFYKKLSDNPSIAKKIIVARGISDYLLHLAYENCLFTIYPSIYEGWGLPVTESMAHGKVPVVADNSSLLEAAEGMGLMFKTGSSRELAKAIESLLNINFRKSLERNIRKNFRQKSWGVVVEDILETIEETAHTRI